MRARLIPGVLALIGLSAAIALNAANGDFSAEGVLFHPAAVVPNVVVGSIILARRGGHVVGWIFTLAGLSWALGVAVEAYARFALSSALGCFPHLGCWGA